MDARVHRRPRCDRHRANLDLKGRYEGTPVDQPPDPELYERVVETFPEAIIEDPALTEETEAVLADEHERISWDAPDRKSVV